MESKQASEHLQVIRTLMERSALYRRALAPIMLFVGAIGLAAALAGWRLGITQPGSFVGFWYGIGAVASIGAFLLVRRQAWQQSEPFWSPPTRRVFQAVLPPLAAGFLLGLWVAIPGLRGDLPGFFRLVFLPVAWVVLYGCAIHAAGFFMSRGMRLFGWGIILLGCAAFLVVLTRDPMPLVNTGYAIMGFFFGLLHIAYGVYLYFTEQRRNET